MIKRTFFYGSWILLLLLLGGAVYFALGKIRTLDREITTKFEGKRWAIPATVYARPLELYPGLFLSPSSLIEELELAGYRDEKKPVSPGGYHYNADRFTLVSRAFDYPTGREESCNLTIIFSDEKISSLQRSDTGETIDLIRLDPARIGSFHPQENKDRLLVSLNEVPALLINTLLTVEDQHFYEHHGLSWQGILRALFANLKAGKTVQGGSTITQQLVKNFFLSNERTLNRKISEAVMAKLLEQHYDKNQILTAYLNEIYLGQDGDRAIHGFGLASSFYFRRDLSDLKISQIATLVGMVKGPSTYSPHRQPENCRLRRNTVLTLMLGKNLINKEEYNRALAEPLLDVAQHVRGFNRFPAFLDLVRKQLLADYREEDLTSNGLKILTTLDPQIQLMTERQLTSSITQLEKRRGVNKLETAAVITNKENGEILALVGGRDSQAGGYNHALSAARPLGSLIKPAIYLTALQRGYGLATEVADVEVNWQEKEGKTWRPQNYDKSPHGMVPLYQALSRSYNLAAINTGFAVGLEAVIDTASRLGLTGDLSPYPSFFLGAAAVSPLSVTQMYQTLAGGGFYLPLRTINSVISSDGKTLKRYGLNVEQRFPSEQVFLINYCLQQVIREGTGKSLANMFRGWAGVAGKTGTSDDLRDSWFAGFTGDKLGVIWLGRNDNRPTGLTGSSGAMTAWANVFSGLTSQPLQLVEPPNIAYRFNLFGESVPVIEKN
jgi:penicillin-binding protein 1B